MDRDLEKLELVVNAPNSIAQSVAVMETGRHVHIPTIGGEIELFIPDHKRDRVRRQFTRQSRKVKRQAAIAGNQAMLAYTVGGSIGGTLATGGLIAIATGSGPIGLAGLAVTTAGLFLTSVGMWVGHRISNMRAHYDEQAEILLDISEDLR